MDRIAACLVDGVIVVISVKEDVEAEREGNDEQGIPAAEGVGLEAHRTPTSAVTSHSRVRQQTTHRAFSSFPFTFGYSEIAIHSQKVQNNTFSEISFLPQK